MFTYPNIFYMRDARYAIFTRFQTCHLLQASPCHYTFLSDQREYTSPYSFMIFIHLALPSFIAPSSHHHPPPLTPYFSPQTSS